MDIQVEKKHPKQIGRTSVLQQTAYWSEVKRKQGFEPKAFDIRVRRNDHFIIDDLLMIVQDIGNGFRIGYVPYGPTMVPDEESQGEFLEELSDLIRPGINDRCIALRYDLSWESFWAKDDAFYEENDTWKGPPPVMNQELRINFNTKKWNLRKSSTNILPSDTLFIDLSQTEEELLRQMRAKTRYNIRLSYRRGVRIRKASFNELDTWYKLYKETCKRNKIHLHDFEYFKTVLGTGADDCLSPAEVELLFAEKNRQPLAAMFLSYSGQRATYLYGASSSAKRNHMATYALQWDAIRRAKGKGYKEYDMFGVAPHPNPGHPLYGLHRFKTGFGGHIYHRLGCWDYPFDAEKYEMFLSAEMNGQGYHLF